MKVINKHMKKLELNMSFAQYGKPLIKLTSGRPANLDANPCVKPGQLLLFTGP